MNHDGAKPAPPHGIFAASLALLAGAVIGAVMARSADSPRFSGLARETTAAGTAAPPRSASPVPRYRRPAVAPDECPL